ncbi:hypothetical protein ABPG72_014605 [Tetrahymena utriculariae]
MLSKFIQRSFIFKPSQKFLHNTVFFNFSYDNYSNKYFEFLNQNQEQNLKVSPMIVSENSQYILKLGASNIKVKHVDKDQASIIQTGSLYLTFLPKKGNRVQYDLRKSFVIYSQQIPKLIYTKFSEENAQTYQIQYKLRSAEQIKRLILEKAGNSNKAKISIEAEQTYTENGYFHSIEMSLYELNSLQYLLQQVYFQLTGFQQSLECIDLIEQSIN